MKNDNTPQLDLLIDYVEGLLDPKSSADVDALLTKHEDVRITVDGMRVYLAQNPGNYDGLHAFLNPKIENDPVFAKPNPEEKSTGRVISIALKFGAIAAALVACIWLFTSNDPNFESQLAHFTAEDQELPITFRGDNDFDYEAITLHYTQAQYEMVVEAANEFTIEPPLEIGLLIAMSHFHLNDFTKAATLLEPIAESESRISHYAVWNLALSELNLNHIAAGETLLKKLVEAGTFKVEESTQLLKSLPKE